ncbi:hypothetical protein LSAT2_008112 [Lamellibrachia satsuma]|nr:hypothetical protein LSAT2_008112 [Lamellibrachia satsuma]
MAGGLRLCLLALAVMTGYVPHATAHKEITCLTFDKDFSGQYGVWTEVIGQVIHDGIGASGRCAYFTGGDGYINIPRFKSAYDAWSQFSMSLWYKRVSDYHMVLLNTEMCGDRPALKILFSPYSGIQVSLRLTNGFTSIYGVGNYQVWNHVVMSWDGKQISLYMNGTLVDSARFGGDGDRMYNSRCDLTIGTVPPHSSPVLGKYNGFLDQVCFYRVGLSSNEVQYLYNHPSTTNLP